MPPGVQIKGVREGLLVSLSDGENGDWPQAERALREEIEKQVDFLKGAKLILDVEEHVVGAAAMGRLRDYFADQGLSLWAVLSKSTATENNAQSLGLATRIHQPEQQDYEEYDEEEQGQEAEVEGQAGILVKRTLRSGFKITHHGHVTIIGDVNPGAQIIAGGNVVVWGRLRGLVHAGAEGDDSAVVCAMDLSPTQLRIASYIAIPPESDGEPQPEIAFVRDEQVVAEIWEPAGAPAKS